MSDEDKFREELRRQEEKAEQRSLTPKTNPLSEEHLRPKPSYQELEEQLRDKKRQIENIEESILRNNGHPKIPIDTGRLGGLGWRKRTQNNAREYFAQGASYEWVLWKVMRETGALIETARRIVEDATREEPFKKEPQGRPKKASDREVIE